MALLQNINFVEPKLARQRAEYNTVDHTLTYYKKERWIDILELLNKKLS